MEVESLPKNWSLAKLGDAADFINGDRGQNYPTQADRVQFGVPFINTGHIEPNGRLTNIGMDYITRESYDLLRNGKVAPGDILYCLRGSTIGKTARNHFAEGAIASSLVIVRAKPNACQEYLYFYLTSPFGRDLVTQHDNGSAQPNLSVRALSNYPFPLPPLPEQRAIAHILGTLDDKIELNRRRNQTLEAMARALFKDWFVDFGPVRARMEGREPYLPANLWQLFPDRLDDEGKPEGWEKGTLGDVAEHPRRTIQPDKINPDAPYIALEHMPKRCIALSDWGIANALESNKYEFKQEEILFGKLRPYFHKVGVAPVDGVCSTDIVVITAEEKWHGFVLCHVSSDEFVEYTNAGSTGTKMPRTSWSEMARYELAIPPGALAEAFNEHTKQWMSQIIDDIHESRTLAQLRDTLLPKLISGELRIADAENFLGDVA